MSFQLPEIAKAAERLMLEIEKAVRQFPRYHKYSVGAELRQQAMHITELTHRAWRERSRQLEWTRQRQQPPTAGLAAAQIPVVAYGDSESGFPPSARWTGHHNQTQEQSMSLITAPPGWGFLPGFPLGGLSAADLPDMPLLRVLERDQRNAAVLKMLRDNPALVRELRPRDLVAKYGLPNSTASILLTRARR